MPYGTWWVVYGLFGSHEGIRNCVRSWEDIAHERLTMDKWWVDL